MERDNNPMLEPGRIAELMREEHSRSVKRGMRLKVEAGGVTGQAPLGYTNKKVGRKTWVEIDPITGPLVQEAFELAATGQHSLRQLIAIMTAKGLRSRRGNKIGPSAFAAMLRNPFYIGQVLIEGKAHKGTHKVLVSTGLHASIKKVISGRRKRWC